MSEDKPAEVPAEAAAEAEAPTVSFFYILGYLTFIGTTNAFMKVVYKAFVLSSV
jgi:hypothetical protein